MTTNTRPFLEVKRRGCCRPHYIFSRENQYEMGRIAAISIIAKMVENWDIFSFSCRYRLYKPRIKKAMGINSFCSETGISIPIVTVRSCPPPTSGVSLESDLRKKHFCSIWLNAFHYKIIYHMGIIGTFIEEVKRNLGWHDAAV